MSLPDLMSTTSLTGCGTVGRFLNFSVPQFPNLKNVADIIPSEDCRKD